MARRRARGEGSIRKRSDGRWEGRYTVGRDPDSGKLIYKNILAKTQTECKTKLRAALRSAEDQQASQTAGDQISSAVQTYTVEAWLHTWYELYSKPNIRDSTQETYTNFIDNHLIPNIGKMELSELTSLRLQKLYSDLRADGKVHRYGRAKDPGLSPKTVKEIHMVLHSALEQAVKEKLIENNPTNDCKPPKGEKKEMKVLQPEQVRGYLKAAADRNVLPMFYLELTSGLRRGELLALLWSDLDAAQNTISVTKAVRARHGELKVTVPKTSHSIRTLALPRQAVELLQQEHALHLDNPYMFPSPLTGTMYHPDAVSRLHHKILKDAGMEEIRFHDLRHTFATLSLQNGVDIKTLSETLGHFSSGFTLDTYTHTTQQMKRDTAEKMGLFMEQQMQRLLFQYVQLSSGTV